MRGDGVATAHRVRQAFRGGLQELIADAVPQGIVDAFEIVQIDEQHGQLPRVALGQLDGLVQAGSEEFPIGQAGQRVEVANWRISTSACALRRWPGAN